MPGFKIVNNSSEITFDNKWIPSTKFNSKDRLVDAKGDAVSSDYKGRQYRIIEKRERHFSTPERIGRGFLGTLAIVCTLFLGLFSKSVRNLFIKPKENVRFGVLVPSSSYVSKIAKTSVEVIAEPTKSTQQLPLKIEEGSKTILQDQEKIVSQVNATIDQLENGWVRERLFQISKFFSSESPLDEFYKAQLQRYSHLIENLEVHFTEKMKKITKSTLENIFEIATATCYDSFNISHKKIIIAGEVSSDGWGDYFQMWLTAKNLTENIPESSVAISADLRNRGVPPQVSKTFQKAKNLIFASNEDLQKKNIEKELKEADLIINIPHGYFPNPGNKPILRVEEYGFSPNNAFALGLSPHSYNVLGIPLTGISPAKSLQELSHVSLEAHLSEKKRPFFLGYLKKDHGMDEQHRAGFVLAAAASYASRSEDIDIICPFEDITKLNTDVLKSLSVARVILMEPDGKGELKEKQSLNLQPQGREIRILNPFPLPNDDWMLLLKFCEPLVGCTGDMSFSEVISNQKIPFYQIRWHKAEFIEQIMELTGYVYKEDFIKLHQFLNVLKSSLEENSKTGDISKNCLNMGLMINEELIAEYQKFAVCIQKHYCTNQILASRVKRELAYAQHPELKKVEEEIFERWKNDEITLEQACKLLQSQIDTSKQI